MRVRLTAVVNFASAAAVCLLLAAADAPRARAQAGAQSRPRAQTPPSAPRREAEGARASRAGEADANADLSITARVTADSLRFEKVPNPRVEFTGQPARQTAWEAERENLPRPVRPGVTYRDIGITLRITSVFADIDRIVAEALGEIPRSDDAQPAAPPPPQPPGANTPPADPTPPPAQ
ncbi:MAG TPA: hypothetical protein VF736_15505, partial [Pyrinomonadaceae bacterium]